MFLGELIEAVDGVTEGACVLDVLPSEGGQTGCERSVTEERVKEEMRREN